MFPKEKKCEFCGKQAERFSFEAFLCASDDCLHAAMKSGGNRGGQSQRIEANLLRLSLGGRSAKPLSNPGKCRMALRRQPEGYDVLAIGDICLDVITSPMKGISMEEGTTDLEYFKFSPGGNATNFSFAAASLGLNTGFVGILGNDIIGDWLAKKMMNAKIAPHITRENVQTSTTVALTFADGTRHFVSTHLSNQLMTEKHIDLKLIEGVKHVHRAGFWWAPKLQGKPTARLLRRAKDLGAETSLDVATDPDGWTKQHRDAALDALAETDVFFCNQAEARGITGLNEKSGGARGKNAKGRGNANKSADLAAKKLLESGVKTVVLHMGKSGSAIYENGVKIFAPGFKAVPKNPTGSGDVYNAGFVYARLNGKALGEAAMFANACGATHIERPDVPYPRAGDVRKRFGLR